MRTPTVRQLAVTMLALATALLAPHAAEAQQPINSTTALKRACEAAVNNYVYVTTDVRITSGPHQNVAGGCQIGLGPSANFEADRVSMRFAGPFRVDSARDRSISFTSSVWKATSVGLYGGAGGAFMSTGSLIEATSGGIEVLGGEQSKIALEGRPAGSAYGLKAAGRVVIFGSGKRSTSVRDTTVEGGRSVRVEVGGTGSDLKAESSQLRSLRGNIGIDSSGPNAVAELKTVTLSSVGGDTTVNLSGTASKLHSTGSSVSSRGGSVNLAAGDNGWHGVVELIETSVTATRGVSVRGSASEWQRFGTATVSKSTVSGGADVVFATGIFGATEVKDSAISSATAIRIFTGTSGSCTAEKNTYRAPRRQLCS